ncbi:MAG TPA: lysylphosphatidylglycerol synthase transmembrane domain-containing protein [Hymenobacter sp.]|uniref:lysylphosphatidylglycerol synthase transmembrane domain-containing protein n=1 Tax=Hymenobacter sp. TaxID=1898978 RepID=UPI002D800DFD|nr:lysylphosphatidylglycerol synthase transmembrane domain-containing protein [Hymenobacter sp.]HET9503450.1 lysylphosphatidylglycerol synthase transmembrane domain-containing protein [Hymenobacter sp.]
MAPPADAPSTAPAAPAWRRALPLLAKLAFMAGALWLVARHLDLPALARTLRHARPGWLAVAAALFIVSKVLASVRLNQFFQAIDLTISEEYNLRLYWLGMFYNLFLPGGIGGDGYKVYLLGRQFPGRRKAIFRALLLDRLSGMVALLVLLLLLFAATDYPGWWRAGALALVPLGLGLSYILGRWWFGEFRGAFGRTSWQALGVQGAQVLQAWALLAALGAAGGPVLPYLLVFLASSIAAVLPLTVGGLGARELTFLYGAKLFALSAPVAVSVSVLFYVITALVSLVGALVRVEK